MVPSDPSNRPNDDDATPQSPDAANGAGDVQRVTLVEETLEPRIVRSQIGSVLIHKSIETHTLRNEVDLERDDVSLEQLVVEEFVDEKREPWYEDDMLVIPVYEEVLVTERRLMLAKVVRVRRDVVVDRKTVEGEVRREVLDVEPRSTEG